MKRRNIKRVVLTVFFMGVMFLYGCSAGNTPEKNGDQAPVPGHASKTAQSVENKAGEDSADKNGKGTTGLQFGEGSENAAKDSGGGLLTDQVDWPEEDRKEMGFTGEKESGDSEKKEDTAAGGEQEEGKKKKTAAGGEQEEGKKKKTAAGGEKEEGKKKKTAAGGEKEEGKSEEIIVNPVTSDNILHYLVLMIISITGLIIIIKKNKMNIFLPFTQNSSIFLLRNE